MKLPRGRELLWALLLLAVLGLGPFYAPGAGHSGSDTWSVRPDGKKVLWTIAQRLFGGARRQVERLLPEEDAGTLWILGPARYPDAAEWQRLHTWVDQGHTLVFAARQSDPAVALAPFGLRVRATSVARTLTPAEGLLPDPPAKPIEWTGAGWIDGLSPGDWVGLRAGTRTVAAFHEVGRGLLVVVASDELFENAWLVNRRRGPVTLRLLERARRDGALVVDESLTVGGPPRVFGLLFSPLVRPVTLQVLAVLVLLAWAGTRVFGAPIGPPPAVRRQISEHAVALGRLHRDSGTVGALVASYLDYVRHECGWRRAAAGDAAARIASRARLDVGRVRALFARAERAAASERPPRAEAAAVIQGLADVRRRVPAAEARW